MNNFDIYKLIHLVANKDIYSNWLIPEQFQLELQSKNIRLMRNILGLPERYQPGTAVGASATRTNEIDLLPFLVVKEVPLTNQETELPDWYYINDFYTADSLAPEIISQQELGTRKNNPLRVATKEYPWAIIIENGLKIYPDTVTNATVSYYRKPDDPTFITTVNTTTGELEYDEDSEELEWADHNKLDIAYMILQDFGVNTGRQEVSQLAQKLVETGK